MKCKLFLSLSLTCALSACGQGTVVRQKSTKMNDSDRKQIETLYGRMYKALIEKDSAVLDEVHADDFVLVHMTGLHQSKSVYIRAIMDGTLNYYKAEVQQLDCQVKDNEATFVGRSRVEAAGFGGGRHTWPLQLSFRLRKENGEWKFVHAEASTY